MTEQSENARGVASRATPLRILVADDHEIVRQGARGLIEIVPGWEICGEAADDRSAVAMAEKLRPDVVVIDLGMPEMG